MLMFQAHVVVGINPYGGVFKLFTPYGGQSKKFAKNSCLQKIHVLCRIKQHCAKVLPKRFHLNGNTIGFRPQNKKLELHTK